MAIFERPLKVGKTDNFTLTLSSGYLDGEVLTTATVTSTDPDIEITSVDFNSSIISAVCNGVSDGDAELHYTWATASRSGCESHIVIILDC